MEAYLRRHYSDFIAANRSTIFSQIISCESDEELEERFMTNAEVKKHYREIKTNGNPILSDDEGQGQGANRLLKKVKNKLKNVLILDNLVKYKQVIGQFR